MLYRDFSKFLLLHPGIVRIELLSDDILEEVRGIEWSSKNINFAPVDPVGLRDIEERDLRLILFCSSEFPMFTDSFMEIVDSRGESIGHDVLISERHKYESPDHIWLTSNLFFDIKLLSDYYIKIIIKSLSMDIDGLPEDVSPIVFYPCAATANYINDRFNVTGKIVSTLLMGVDGVKF